MFMHIFLNYPKFLNNSGLFFNWNGKNKLPSLKRPLYFVWLKNVLNMKKLI